MYEPPFVSVHCVPGWCNTLDTADEVPTLESVPALAIANGLGGLPALVETGNQSCGAAVAPTASAGGERSGRIPAPLPM